MKQCRVYVFPNSFGIDLRESEFKRLFGEDWIMKLFGSQLTGLQVLLMIFPTLATAERCGVTREEWRKYHEIAQQRIVPGGRIIYT